MNNNSIEPQVAEWIKKAQDDELNAKSILKHQDGTPGGVCFLSQQMAEKYLKAFLLHNGMLPKKMHALDALLEECMKFDPSLSSLQEEVIYLTEFYIATRYPGDFPEFYWSDADKALQSASNIQQQVLQSIDQ